MKTWYDPTRFGFEYGPATVERLFSDADTGVVVIGIESPRSYVHVRVTKTGLIRVFSAKGELRLEANVDAKEVPSERH